MIAREENDLRSAMPAEDKEDVLYAVIIIDQTPDVPDVTVFGPTRSKKKAEAIADEFSSRANTVTSVESMTPAPRLGAISSLAHAS
jgi:hypothetical protein